MSKFSELRCKEVINIENGVRLGFVDDVTFDADTGQLLNISILGPGRILGIFAREDDYVIEWKNISKIGDDTVLVSYEMPPRAANNKQGTLSKLWMQFLNKIGF